MPNLEELTHYRLSEIQDAAESFDWSNVGKAIGRRDPVTGRIEEDPRRIRGGWHDLFPELPSKYGPTATAKALRKGKGIIFRRIVASVQEGMKPYATRERKKRPPSVPGHDSLTGKCKLCQIPHSKKQHRFHGPGSFHKTHLWGFAMNKPTEEMPLVYGRVLQVLAQKTQVHRCDAGCKKVGHRYYHNFKTGPKEYGLPAGAVIVLPSGRRVKVVERSLLIAKTIKG
jgi:hypothetical protein